jgi:hypothetical protein
MTEGEGEIMLEEMDEAVATAPTADDAPAASEPAAAAAPAPVAAVKLETAEPAPADAAAANADVAPVAWGDDSTLVTLFERSTASYESAHPASSASAVAAADGASSSQQPSKRAKGDAHLRAIYQNYPPNAATAAAAAAAAAPSRPAAAAASSSAPLLPHPAGAAGAWQSNQTRGAPNSGNAFRSQQQSYQQQSYQQRQQPYAGSGANAVPVSQGLLGPPPVPLLPLSNGGAQSAPHHHAYTQERNIGTPTGNKQMAQLVKQRQLQRSAGNASPFPPPTAAAGASNAAAAVASHSQQAEAFSAAAAATGAGAGSFAPGAPLPPFGGGGVGAMPMPPMPMPMPMPPGVHENLMEDASLTNLLLAWYYAGYYTGKHQALREAGAAHHPPPPPPPPMPFMQQQQQQQQQQQSHQAPAGVDGMDERGAAGMKRKFQ